jgi:hypothetical protein
MNDPAKLIRHYQRFLSKEPRKVLEQDGVAIWHFDAKDGSLLITAGMSAQVQVIPPGQECLSSRPRTELMMFVSEQDEGVLSKLLLDLASYPKAQGAFLHWWHALPLGRPIISNVELTSLLLTFPPYDDKFATIELDGERIDILWVVPISETERTYFTRYGVDALEEQFEASEIDVANLSRKSVV